MKTTTLADLAAINIDRAAAHAHLGSMASSAALALADARSLAAKGDYFHAVKRASASLEYSVGILHPVCAQARTDARNARAFI